MILSLRFAGFSVRFGVQFEVVCIMLRDFETRVRYRNMGNDKHQIVKLSRRKTNKDISVLLVCDVYNFLF